MTLAPRTDSPTDYPAHMSGWSPLLYRVRHSDGSLAEYVRYAPLDMTERAPLDHAFVEREALTILSISWTWGR